MEINLGVILSNYSYVFLLILIRYAGLFIITPIFGSQVLPVRIKVGTSFLLALITMPVLNIQNFVFPNNGIIVFFDILRELSIGLTMGFIVLIVFTVVQLAGRFIDIRMGFAIVNTIDPISGQTAPITGQFKNILAVLLFLAINGHHLLIEIIYQSFEIIPLASFQLTSAGMQYLLRVTGDLFILAFKMGLPIIGSVFIADVILGLMAKAIPQMNIFVVGLPLKILVGFSMLILSIGVTMYFLYDIFQDMFQDLLKFLNLLF